MEPKHGKRIAKAALGFGALGRRACPVSRGFAPVESRSPRLERLRRKSRIRPYLRSPAPGAPGGCSAAFLIYNVLGYGVIRAAGSKCQTGRTQNPVGLLRRTKQARLTKACP